MINSSVSNSDSTMQDYDYGRHFELQDQRCKRRDDIFHASLALSANALRAIEAFTAYFEALLSRGAEDTITTRFIIEDDLQYTYRIQETASIEDIIIDNNTKNDDNANDTNNAKNSTPIMQLGIFFKKIFFCYYSYFVLLERNFCNGNGHLFNKR